MAMINEFSKSIGMIPEKILGDSRNPEVSCARQLFWKILREKGRRSFREIGEMNDRDTSTILLGIKRINGLLDSGDALAVSMWDKVKHLNEVI